MRGILSGTCPLFSRIVWIDFNSWLMHNAWNNFSNAYFAKTWAKLRQVDILRQAWDTFDCSVVWHALTFTTNTSSTSVETQFFKRYMLIPTYSSNDHVNQMGLLQMTVNYRYVNKNVLWQRYLQNVHEWQALLTSQLPVQTTFNIAKTSCMSLDTRCLYWSCPWSWWSNPICSWFIDWAKFCGFA